YGREEKYDHRLDDDLPSLVTMPAATAVIDPYTRKKRKPSYEDLVNLTKLQELMGTLTVAGGIVTPQDVPLESSDWYTWSALIKNTGKHICGDGVGKVGVQDAVAMAQLALGDTIAFEDRPWISFWVLTSPPMRMTENTLNVLVEASRLNAPLAISSGGILGISSPMTIESAVIQTHAENLAAIALTQLVRPGVSVLYSTFVRSMDMKTMSVAMASPETAIMKSITAELGHYLNLPTMMPTCLRDSKVLDAQAGFETGMVGTVGAYTSDFLIGLQLDSDLVVDYADLPYTNECIEQLRRLVKKLDFSDKRIALDNIKKVGHGGNYLNSKHTAKNFRKELWVSDLTERG
ncbi:MAG: trimethylamine methyltransferase family protein, partial [Eubacterium sp.]